MISWSNLGLILLRVKLQIHGIEASYVTIHKVYFIFGGPFEFGGLARSHTLHAPKDALDSVHTLLEERKSFTTIFTRPHAHI